MASSSFTESDRQLVQQAIDVLSRAVAGTTQAIGEAPTIPEAVAQDVNDPGASTSGSNAVGTSGQASTSTVPGPETQTTGGKTISQWMDR